MASEETESLIESCSNTRSERGSKDRVSETESVNIESVNSQKSTKKFRSDVLMSHLFIVTIHIESIVLFMHVVAIYQCIVGFDAFVFGINT